MDSLELSNQLISLDALNKYKPAFQLGIDMLLRLGKFQDILDIFFEKGMVINFILLIFSIILFLKFKKNDF